MDKRIMQIGDELFMLRDRKERLERLNDPLMKWGVKEIKDVGDCRKDEIEITGHFQDIYRRCIQYFALVTIGILHPGTGKAGEYTYISQYGRGVCVFVLINKTHVLLIKEYSRPLGQWMIQFCRGRTLENEDPVIAILQREVPGIFKEAQLTSRIQKLDEIYENPGISNGTVENYLVEFQSDTADPEKLQKDIRKHSTLKGIKPIVRPLSKVKQMIETRTLENGINDLFSLHVWDQVQKFL